MMCGGYCVLLYLPGPAVRPDVLPTDHPGHNGGEGGQPAPIGWEDRQTHRSEHG